MKFYETHGPATPSPRAFPPDTLAGICQNATTARRGRRTPSGTATADKKKSHHRHQHAGSIAAGVNHT
ncbi:MAG: hypothetical protein VZQ96_09520 [Succiniclasticum sp.]|nr:hypothetical protein [Succiniclasticum sp.]